MKTKILAVIACSLLLVMATVFVTVAFLTSTDSVTNTFTVGNVKINLDEEDVDELGNSLETPARTEEGNEYKLFPGRTYKKDPTVTVKAGSEECYVRMLVTITEIDTIDAVFPKADLTSIFSGYDAQTWVSAGSVKDADAKTRTFEFRYKETVDAGESEDDIKLAALFTGFTVPGALTGEQLASIEDAEIKVVAHAIQADGFDTADAAWAAFDSTIK